MIFNSFSFAVFVIVVISLIPFFSASARPNALIFISYIFYATSNPAWLPILIAITVVDFHLARWMDAHDRPAGRKIVFVISCTVNLGLLFSFKYAGFVATSLNTLLSAANLEVMTVPVPSPELPLGISFFVFESLSYMIDVYRRRMRPVESLADYALFISFFPHLMAGPIVRANDFIPQIKHHKVLTQKQTVEGIELILWGLFKKVVVADNLSPRVDYLFSQGGNLSGGAVCVAAILFAVQIYCDFSGYTDMARGLARLLGFKLCLNFYWPYFSQSIRVFWQRWHISLSSWLRDYLYIPLGGSKNGIKKWLLPLF